MLPASALPVGRIGLKCWEIGPDGGGVGGIAGFQGPGVIHQLPEPAVKVGRSGRSKCNICCMGSSAATLGQPWAAGGGAGGANGLGRQAMNAGIGGANGMNIGAMGYIPAGQAGRGGFTNQPPHAGGMGGGIPMMGGGAVGANGLGGPAECRIQWSQRHQFWRHWVQSSGASKRRGHRKPTPTRGDDGRRCTHGRRGSECGRGRTQIRRQRMGGALALAHAQ